MLTAQGAILRYKEIEPLESRGFSYLFSIETEHQLINFMSSAEHDEVEKLVKQIFDQNFVYKQLSVNEVRLLITEMVTSYIKAMKHNNISFSCLYGDEELPFEHLFEYKTVEDFKKDYLSLVRKLCDYIEKKRKNYDNELMEKVLDYINNHYDDDSLSLKMLAEKFFIGHTYLSKLMRSYTGDGFLNIINAARLRKAKELLKTTDKNVQEIAERVGYYDSNTFIRVFKKYEGITPGQFRKL